MVLNVITGVIRRLKRSPNDENNNIFNGLNGGLIVSASPQHTTQSNDKNNSLYFSGAFDK